MKTAFWLAPDRWEGIDPHKTMFWERRQRDVIDVRRKAKVALDTNLYLNAYQNANASDFAGLLASQANVSPYAPLRGIANGALNFLRL